MTDVLAKPNLTRRHFLIGAGGFTLAVPFLSSVLPRGTKADGAVQRRFIAMGTDHGGVFPVNMYPERPSDWTTMEAHPGTADMPRHVIGAGPLTAEARDGETVISSCLRAPETLLSPTILGKMNFIGGLSITNYLSHTRGMMLGNYAANNNGDGNNPNKVMSTIDQLIARSPGFALAPTKERSFNYANRYGGGSGVLHAASADTVGGVTSAVQADLDPRTIWDRLFADSAGGTPTERPELVVDRVYEHYRNLTTGAFGDAARLSSTDRQRLDNHMERLLDLERRLSVRVDCGVVGRPGAGSGRDGVIDAVDLAATALVCGATNVVVITSVADAFSSDDTWTNWHEQIAHNGGGARREGHDPRFQEINYQAQGAFFRQAFLRLVNALDSEEESGGETVLDRSLAMWVMESGDVTHDNKCMPVVTAGGACGAVRTGQFIDYRNLDNERFRFLPDTPESYPGLLYNRYLASVMRSMGVTPEEWGAELDRVYPAQVADGARGYGAMEYHSRDFWRGASIRDTAWPWSYYETADEPLPFFLA